jgi:Tfp pilus assembly protein PilX
MCQTMGIIKKQEGSIAAIVLLILTILTLVGVASLNTSNTEVITAGNNIVLKQNLYRAEAAAVENCQAIETSSGEDLLDMPVFSWLNDLGDLPDPASISNPDNWTDVYSQTSIDADTRFLSVYEGIVVGGSLDMSQSQIRDYTIYGRTRESKGLTVVRLGYRRAF